MYRERERMTTKPTHIIACNGNRNASIASRTSATEASVIPTPGSRMTRSMSPNNSYKNINDDNNDKNYNNTNK